MFFKNKIKRIKYKNKLFDDMFKMYSPYTTAHLE